MGDSNVTRDDIKSILEEVKNLRNAMDSFRIELISLRSEMNSRFANDGQKLLSITQSIEALGTELERNLTVRMTDTVEALGLELERKLSDGLARYSESVMFIKQKISDQLDIRPEKPNTHETMIPGSISSYKMREIPARPWIPPKHRMQ